MISVGPAMSIVGRNNLKNCCVNKKIGKMFVTVYPSRAKSLLQFLGKASVSIIYKESCIQEDLFIVLDIQTKLLSFATAPNLVLVRVTYQVESPGEKFIVEALSHLFKDVENLKKSVNSSFGRRHFPSNHLTIPIHTFCCTCTHGKTG